MDLTGIQCRKRSGICGIISTGPVLSPEYCLLVSPRHWLQRKFRLLRITTPLVNKFEEKNPLEFENAR